MDFDGRVSNGFSSVPFSILLLLNSSLWGIFVGSTFIEVLASTIRTIRVFGTISALARFVSVRGLSLVIVQQPRTGGVKD